MTPDDRALAAELVLGLLDADEHAAAGARLLTDRAFAVEVAYWQAWLMPLVHGAPDVAPPDTLEPRVMAAISSGVPGATARRSGWRGLAFAAVAAAAAVALLLGPLHAPAPVPPPRGAVPAPLLAALAVPADQQAAGRGALAAAVDAGAGVVRVSPVGAVPSRRAAELWAIGADGAAPVSLGLLAANGSTRIAVPVAARSLLRAGTTLAVSIEPVGGSRTGAPTGPVVAAGVIAAG
jgi:anti-sigma-K factor RskA